MFAQVFSPPCVPGDILQANHNNDQLRNVMNKRDNMQNSVCPRASKDFEQC